MTNIQFGFAEVTSLENTHVSYIFLIFSGSPETILLSLSLIQVITSAIKLTVTFKIFPINVGQDNIKKAQKFFDDLDIKNLDLYFDENINLTKKFGLRGIPTSILINKNGKEFARIIGSIDFNEEKFTQWLKNYN